MIQMLESKLDIQRLLDNILTLPFKLDGTGARMAFPPGKGLPNDPILLEAANEIALIRQSKAIHLMTNVIPPHLRIPKHQDQIVPLILPDRTVHHPHLERWHLPLVGFKSWWWDEDDGYMFLLPGRWYGPVPYWKMHAVGNDGDVERVHFIVDLEREVP